VTADDYSNAEIVRSLKRIEDGQKDLSKKVDDVSAGFVPRREWQLWADARDRELKEIKDDAASASASRHVPWPMVVGVALTGLTALVTLILALSNRAQLS